MKKLLLILSLVFLNNTEGISQNKISKAEFEQLVDYANCKYVIDFIKQHDESKSDYFKTYQKNVEPKLQAASLDDLENVLSFDNLNRLLNDNTPAQNLAKKINEIKNKYNECPDNISLFNSLSITKWNKIDLSKKSTTIKNNILAKYKSVVKNNVNSNSISETEEVDNQTLQNSTEQINFQDVAGEPQTENSVSELNLKIEKLQKSVNRIFWIQIFVIMLFVGFCVFLFVNYKNTLNLNNNNSRLKNFVKNLVLNSEEINNHFQVKSNHQIRNENFNKPQSFKLSKIELDNVVDAVLHYIRLEENAVLNHDPKPLSSKPIEKYFKTKNGKILQEELPNSVGSSFRVYNINNNQAMFDYCGDIVNTDFFDGVCVFQNNPAEVPNKTKILTTSAGTVKKDTSGNWNVESQATIKFI